MIQNDTFATKFAFYIDAYLRRYEVWQNIANYSTAGLWDSVSHHCESLPNPPNQGQDRIPPEFAGYPESKKVKRINTNPTRIPRIPHPNESRESESHNPRAFEQNGAVHWTGWWPRGGQMMLARAIIAHVQECSWLLVLFILTPSYVPAT